MQHHPCYLKNAFMLPLPYKVPPLFGVRSLLVSCSECLAPKSCPRSGTQFRDKFRCSKIICGVQLGGPFRAPVLGSRFRVQFWDPVLDQIWDQKTSIVGPTFWDQIRVHFWGPNFGLSYIVNKGWIPGPSFGTKNGPTSGTK